MFALVFHPFSRMKARIATISLFAGPVRRHPACPAKLAEPAKPHGLGGPGRYCQLDIVVELFAVIEEHQIRQRFAKVAGRQEADISRKIFRKDPDPDLVLNAEDAAAQQRVLAKHVVPLAENRPLGSVEDKARADEFVDLGFDAEYSADSGGQAR